MKLKQSHIDSNNADDPELRRLYETAFPIQEQIPYDDLIQLLDAMDIDHAVTNEDLNIVLLPFQSIP